MCTFRLVVVLKKQGGGNIALTAAPFAQGNTENLERESRGILTPKYRVHRLQEAYLNIDESALKA